MFFDELRVFRTRGKLNPSKRIRLVLRALPRGRDGDSHPASFVPYAEMTSRLFRDPGKMVIRYGRSLITVIVHIRKREIQVAVAPELSSLPDSAYHLCFTQPLSFWLKKQGLFFLHAGCVTDGARGILIVGGSRVGKSVLTVSAVRGGFRFLSDEQPLLSLHKEKLLVRSFPRRIRLDSSVARVFPELRSPQLSSQPERLTIIPEKVWRGCLAPSCEPRFLIFPEFNHRGRLRLHRMSSVAAFDKLLQDDHFVWYRDNTWGQISRSHLALFERLIQQAAAFRLDYRMRDVFKIPSLFRELLRG